MSERDQYPPGVPCWVDIVGPDIELAMRFYGELLGWEFAGPGRTPGEQPAEYFVARLRGRDVAGVGARPEPGPPPAWTTYIAVTDVDEALERAGDAGAMLLAGPIDASPAGKLAVLGDPAGAVFGVWEAEQRQGARLVNEPAAWSMSVLHTSDPVRAQAFYAEMFGWQHDALEMGAPGGALCRLPGYVGGEPQQPVPRDVVAVMVPANGEAGQRTPSWAVDFWIDDADAAAEKAAALGGTVVVAPHDIPGFRTAVLADPHGAVFSLSALNLGP